MPDIESPLKHPPEIFSMGASSSQGFSDTHETPDEVLHKIDELNTKQVTPDLAVYNKSKKSN